MTRLQCPQKGFFLCGGCLQNSCDIATTAEQTKQRCHLTTPSLCVGYYFTDATKAHRYVCWGVFMCVQMPTEARVQDPSEAGFTGGCELPLMVYRYGTQQEPNMLLITNFLTFIFFTFYLKKKKKTS